jgi:hypothetical protein
MATDQKRVNAMREYLAGQQTPAPSASPVKVDQMKAYADRSSHAFNPKNPNSQFVQPTPAGAQQMQYRPEDKTGTGLNFLKALPGAALQVGVGSPIKLAVSGVEGVTSTVKTGENYSGKTYKVPGLQPFKSFQSESVERANAGQNPLLNVGQAALEVAGAGADSVGLAKGAKFLASGAKSLVVKQAAKSAAKSVAKTTDAVGQIIQGTTDDIEPARKALSKIDYKKAKTYEDLDQQLAASEKSLVDAKGAALSTDTTPRKLPTLTTKVGNTPHNFVEDAFNQLDDYYKKTNNIAKQGELNVLRAKAAKDGLTIKEIDDLAVRHGQDLNAYNKSGDLAAALSKQEAENTRAGLKTTARELFGNDAYKGADAELSATINTRKLIQKQIEEVNKLRQKITERGFFERLGRLGGQVVNVITRGGAKGFFEFFLSRGTGMKTLNAIELEKALQKNLQLLQKANKAGASDADVMKALDDIVREAKGKPAPVPTQTVRPADLQDYGKYYEGMKGKPIKVTDYQQPDLPKYITPDQVSRQTKVLRYLDNAKKTIDMGIKKVTKRY